MILDFTIKNYKNFKDFKLEDLRQFNLFVGQNNAGKTNLLEAFMLYAERFNMNVVYEILNNRLEDVTCFEQKGNYSEMQEIAMLEPLVTDRDRNVLMREKDNTIVLGSGDDILQFALVHAFSRRITLTEQSIVAFANYQVNVLSNTNSKRTAIVIRKALDYQTDFELLRTNNDQSVFDVFWFNGSGFSISDNIPKPGRIPAFYLHCKKNGLGLFLHEWNKIVLTKQEEEINEILRSLIPTIQRVAVISRSDKKTIPYVLLTDGTRMPITAMGDGMLHVIMILMACWRAKGGILLLDEPECGLHYSTLHYLWEIVTKAAVEMNVQIFVSTHSVDCVSAFIKDKTDDNTRVIRLEKSDTLVRGMVYPNLKMVDYSLKNELEIR